MDGIFFLLFILIAIGGTVASRVTRARRMTSLQAAAAELGLRAGKIGVNGDINGYRVSTEYLSGRRDNKGTRIRVAYPAWLGFNLRVATDQLGELRKIPLLGAAMPAQDIHIGRPDVDDPFLIQGDTTAVTAWFTPRRRDMVSRASSRFQRLEITDRRVEAHVNRQVTDPDELARLVRAVVFMAETAYLDEGTPPAPIGSDPFDSRRPPKMSARESIAETTAVPDEPPGTGTEEHELPEYSTASDVYAEDPDGDVIEVMIVDMTHDDDAGATADDTIPAATTEPVATFAMEEETAADPWMVPGTPILEPEERQLSTPAPTEAEPRDSLPSPEPEADSATEPSVTPAPAQAPIASVAALAELLFAEYSPAYEIQERFDREAKGAAVTWSGALESVGEYRRDRYLGEGPGTEVELLGHELDDGRQVVVFAALPEDTEIDGLRTGKTITVAGTLSAIDAIMRRLYVTDARLV